MLVDIDEVDKKQAEEAKQRAMETMQQYKDSKDKIDMERFIEAQDMMLKSVAQLKLYEIKR